MSNNEMQAVAKIRAQYTEQKKTKLDELKEQLDNSWGLFFSI